LSEELPKSGDVPMSPLPLIGGLGAIGGRNLNLKIDLGFYRERRRHPHVGTCANPIACAPNSLKNSPEEKHHRVLASSSRPRAGRSPQRSLGSPHDGALERLIRLTTPTHDRPVIRKIVREATPDDQRWSAIIFGIVKSKLF
jgi:hypothetical protein